MGVAMRPMVRHDDVHGSFPPSPENTLYSDPTLPGMHTTAIAHRQGHRSFRRITPLATLGNRRRRGIVPPRPMRHPPHFLDKPGDAPECKGYTFVTFSTKSHLEAVIRAWPWRCVHK